MHAIDNNPALLSDIVDLCQRYGWTGVGQEHDILRWLRVRLSVLDHEAVKVTCDYNEPEIEVLSYQEELRESERALEEANETIERLRSELREHAKSLRQQGEDLASRADELEHLAEDN